MDHAPATGRSPTRRPATRPASSAPTRTTVARPRPASTPASRDPTRGRRDHVDRALTHQEPPRRSHRCLTENLRLATDRLRLIHGAFDGRAQSGHEQDGGGLSPGDEAREVGRLGPAGHPHGVASGPRPGPAAPDGRDPGGQGEDAPHPDLPPHPDLLGPGGVRPRAVLAGRPSAGRQAPGSHAGRLGADAAPGRRARSHRRPGPAALDAGVLPPAQRGALTGARNARHPGQLQREIARLGHQLEHLALARAPVTHRPVNRSFKDPRPAEVLREATSQGSRRM